MFCDDTFAVVVSPEVSGKFGISLYYFIMTDTLVQHHQLPPDNLFVGANVMGNGPTDTYTEHVVRYLVVGTDVVIDEIIQRRVLKRSD